MRTSKKHPANMIDFMCLSFARAEEGEGELDCRQLMALMAQMVRWSPCQWQATTSTTSCGPGLKDIAGNMQEYTRILLMYGVQSFSFSLLSSTVFYVCEEMSKEHSSSPKGEPILVVWRAPKGKIEYQTTTTKTARTTHAHTHTLGQDTQAHTQDMRMRKFVYLP